MKRKIAITALCCGALLSVGWLLRAAQQPSQKINTQPGSPIRIEPAKDGDATGKTVAAAKAFLATLDEAGRAKTSLTFDNETRRRWTNLPVGAGNPRNGVRWGDLTPPQRAAAEKLLAIALSKAGWQKVKEIMEGDETLRVGQAARGGRSMFGRDEYYLAFLGAPSLTEPWLLQFGGHHLAINLTLAGKANVMTPSLPATQPATFQLNGETVRPLGRESDKGFALINALDAEQQKQAILPYQVRNLVLGAGEDGKTIAPEGIKVSALNKTQQAQLWDVVHEWVGILNDEAAAKRMAELKANLNETWFAWSGPTTKGSVAYYRIQGPTLLIEYSPQGNTEHIHTIYRDPTNDYGARLTKQSIKQ